MLATQQRETRLEKFLFSNDQTFLQFDRVHKFLSEEAYWSKGIPRDVVEKAARNSMSFGIYREGVQIGYGRIVSDFTTFAWFSDIYVESEFRGQGLSKKLVEFMMATPELKGLRRLCLATQDAHGLYEKFGFEITKTPTYWMEIKHNDIYQKPRM